MRMSYEEFDLANDKFLEDPDNNPLPIPCITEGCDEEILEYVEDAEVYICPVCGRIVDKYDVEEYLESIVNRTEW